LNGSQPSTKYNVSLLTGGGDRPYALGMATALIAEGLAFDFIGSNEHDVPELQNNHQVRFFNLRGDQNPHASRLAKALRVLRYYSRLLRYAASAEPRIFHILWNGKLELVDRTALMLYYKCLGKRLIFTAHNVNAGQRDRKDTVLNQLSLQIQYRLFDHIFVHTEKMKRQLCGEFSVADRKVTVIPFGINNTVPHTALTASEAKERLGLNGKEKVLLFFGHITPYKGLEYAISALAQLSRSSSDYRLVIAGRPKDCGEYWAGIQRTITRTGTRRHIIERAVYIPEEEVEVYFKGADVLVLPYRHIFQSGVLFLGYSFGLPVIATDVGSLKEDILEGKTGFTCRPEDALDLAKAIEKYFSSSLFRELERRRQDIRNHANERYSWAKVGEKTRRVYSELLEK
jgi:glycosyltransferase involved in cell wall biosynthesis